MSTPVRRATLKMQNTMNLRRSSAIAQSMKLSLQRAADPIFISEQWFDHDPSMNPSDCNQPVRRGYLSHLPEALCIGKYIVFCTGYLSKKGVPCHQVWRAKIKITKIKPRWPIPALPPKNPLIGPYWTVPLLLHWTVPLLHCSFTELFLYCIAPLLHCSFTELFLYWIVPLLHCSFTALLLYWIAPLLHCSFTELFLYCIAPLLHCSFTELFLYCIAPLLNCSFTEVPLLNRSFTEFFLYGTIPLVNRSLIDL